MKRSASHLRLSSQLGADPKWSWKVGMPVQLGEHEHLVIRTAKERGLFRDGLYLTGLPDAETDPLVKLSIPLDSVRAGCWCRLDADNGTYNPWPLGTGPLPAWWHPAMLGFLRASIIRAARDRYQARDLLLRKAPNRDLGMVGAETHTRVLLDLWKRGSVIHADFEES